MSEYHSIEHASPIKTPKQLVIVVALAFVVPVLVIIMLAQIALGTKKTPANTAASEEAIARRIKPVGEVAVAEPSSAALPPQGGVTLPLMVPAINAALPTFGQNALQARSGKTVVEAACSACHSTGALNAPKIGDNAAWGKLIPRGLDALVANATKGIRQMPARGGKPDLTDFEIARAIVHMANQSGGNLKEPDASAFAAAPPPAAAAAESVAAAPVAATAAPGADAAKGKSVYDATCAACHSVGVAGAPKAGDKAAWAPRLKAGKDTLVASVIKGKGVMPPKGGNASLSDGDIKAAVDYLAGLAQ